MISPELHKDRSLRVVVLPAPPAPVVRDYIFIPAKSRSRVPCYRPLYCWVCDSIRNYEISKNHTILGSLT